MRHPYGYLFQRTSELYDLRIRNTNVSTQIGGKPGFLRQLADFQSFNFKVITHGRQPSRQAAFGGRMNPGNGALRMDELTQHLSKPAQRLAGVLPLRWARKAVGGNEKPVSCGGSLS